VIDNNHGKWAPHPPDGWWITAGCPIHAPTPQTPLSFWSGSRYDEDEGDDGDYDLGLKREVEFHD
jgi:hypothetical protein